MNTERENNFEKTRELEKLQDCHKLPLILQKTAGWRENNPAYSEDEEFSDEENETDSDDNTEA